MPLTLGTNAYATAEEVAAYLEARGLGSGWADATTTAKEAAIIEATSFMDGAFTWVGRIESTDQALGWPRVDAYDAEGRTLSGIPQPVKNACAELALLALGGRLMPMQRASEEVGAVKREKGGQVEVEYDTATLRTSSYEYVRIILRGIGMHRTSAMNMMKLRRV